MVHHSFKPAPLLAELRTWLDDQEFLPKSQIGKAATYR